jgi:Flp pilus assembly protein TadG
VNGRFSIRGRSSEARGQSVVEFALLAPIMIFLLFAILDLSRVYTAMSSVESAAREAADYGTAQGAERWSTTNFSTTVREMQRRACTAARELHDFAWTDSDADRTVDAGEPCTNPSFDWCVSESTGGACTKTYPVDVIVNPTTACDNPDRPTPCTVTVTMDHDFHLFVPFQLDFFGVRLGLPVTLDFQRDSTFAMTDIDVAP